jgi:hypothetical protein
MSPKRDDALAAATEARDTGAGGRLYGMRIGSTNANVAPNKKLTSAIAQTMTLILRNRWHERASLGSAGHGARRPIQSAVPLMVNSEPAMINTGGLCSLNQISCGTAVTKAANAAPAPTATSTAGNTQHTSVTELAINAPAARPALRANLGSLT